MEVDDDMEPANVVVLDYEDLVKFTDNFSDANYIGRFQFGKLYRGVSGKFCSFYMLVKIWEIPEIYHCKPQDNKLRLMEEIILLRHEMLIKHPAMVKLYGYCCERGHLAVVYIFKAFDSAFNLIPKDSFTWRQRIKTAFGLASLLKFLHARFYSSYYLPCVVQNLDASHIVLDEDYNPKLCDFGLISGGLFPIRRTGSGHHAMGCYGYIDVGHSSEDNPSDKQDVFAFGVILLSLMSKRVYTEEDRQAGVPSVYEWALRESEAFDSYNDMKDTEFSLVHKSIAADPDFCLADGHKITMLGLACVNRVQHERPNMKQVFRALLKLEVVKHHADFIGATNNLLLCPRANIRL